MTSDRRQPSIRTRTRDHSAALLSGVSRIERLLWALVGVGLLADLLTTYYGLQIGLTESNPVVHATIDRFGFSAMVGLKLFAVAVGLCCRRLLTGRFVLFVPAGLAVPWLAAALINLSLSVAVHL